MEVIFIAHFVLLIWASPTNSQQCTDEDWTKRLHSMSQCSASASYVNGLISQGYGVNFQYGPGVIKKARCCDVNLPYSQESNDCYEEQWWFSLLISKNNWDATCKRNGYLIHGLFIAGPNRLYDIQKSNCCKPTSHPDQDGACQDIDVDFKADGTKQCPLGFFLKGIYKSNCIRIECLTKIRCCRMIAGRVDGRWSDWGEWQACSKTCGNGSQRRLRTCTNPRPSGGGARCPGTPVQFQQCNKGTCPVDGRWSDWSSWGACSVTCGGGSQQRSRSCTNPSPSSGGKPCTGDETESQECNKQGCQLDGRWSDWSSWGACSVACGGGSQQRSRSCTNPPPSSSGKPCIGYKTESQECNKQGCQRRVDGRWSDWGEWQACSKTCGNGSQRRLRTCTNPRPSGGGARCPGTPVHFQQCNKGTCPGPCGKPDDIPHATYVGTSFKYNEKLRYSCEKGYTLSGPKRRTCRRDGKWSSGPTCSRVSCGDPGRPLHGQRIGWFFQYNDTVSFVCFWGYFLEGPKTRTCLADQTWSETQPVCKLNCSDNPCDNGGTCLDLGDTAVCKCLPGYTGSTCLEVKRCPPLKVPENGTYTLSSRDRFPFLQGPSKVSPAWSDISLPVSPLSDGKKEREEIYRDRRFGRLFQYDDTVSFRCFGGYFLEGPKTRTCLANQTWSETQPICKPLGPCSPNPCQNGGQCYNLSNSEHYCACDSGFTGDNCEKVNCSGHPCRNGGTCLDLGDTAICKCLPGYTGSICQGVIPSITKDPIDSVRMAGDVVKFCCEAKGDPAPKYAWFHNDAQIPNESSSSLRLSSISQADAGSYKCRATNEYGAVFSSKAGLTVIDGSGNDSCDPIPLSKVETLPPGCFEDSSGSSSVNVGACSYDTCVKRGQGDSGECREQEGSRQCCSPASKIDSPVTCTKGAKFSIQKVRRCACAKCAVPDTIVHGRAVDPDGNPLKQGDITVEGDPRRYKTDLSGYFKISVKPGTKRLVFTIVDNRLRQLQETTKAFTLHESQVSFYTIVLQKKPPAITFSAKQEQNINLGGSSGKPSFANLDIPANAFITADGTIYDGEITANIGVVDPRSQADMAAAPGDFSAIDENGEEEMLSTAGILRQTFTDSNGNQLTLGKNITVRVDADQLDIPDGVEVYQWYLNKQTGRWVKFGVLRPENGGQRRKRQQARKFFVSDITPNVPYDTINWDYVSVASYVRVRAPPGTVVTRIGGTANGPFTSYRQETVPASGILCILSVRNQPSVLQAALNGVPLLPQQPTNFPAAVSAQIIRGSASGPTSGVQSFQFTSTKAGDTGPVYLKGESGRCQQSGPNDLAFEFGAASPGNNFHWKTKNPNWFAGNFCYMKAVVSGSRPDSVIYVKSTGKAQGQPTLDYGYTAEKSTVVGNQGVVCLEYSCNEGQMAAYRTHLQVLTLTGSCTIQSLNSALTGGQNNCRVPPDADSSQEQNFCVPMLQGGDAGLYTDNTALAKIKCLAGDNGYTGPTAESPGPPPTTATGAAVQLSCN